jgi:hypothetical protein
MRLGDPIGIDPRSQLKRRDKIGAPVDVTS